MPKKSSNDTGGLHKGPKDEIMIHTRQKTVCISSSKMTDADILQGSEKRKSKTCGWQIRQWIRTVYYTGTPGLMMEGAALLGGQIWETWLRLRNYIPRFWWDKVETSPVISVHPCGDGRFNTQYTTRHLPRFGPPWHYIDDDVKFWRRWPYLKARATVAGIDGGKLYQKIARRTNLTEYTIVNPLMTPLYGLYNRILSVVNNATDFNLQFEGQEDRDDSVWHKETSITHCDGAASEWDLQELRKAGPIAVLYCSSHRGGYTSFTGDVMVKGREGMWLITRPWR
jgi:hypothetical protein